MLGLAQHDMLVSVNHYLLAMERHDMLEMVQKRYLGIDYDADAQRKTRSVSDASP